jgi:glycosyltransferase 2 family protein
LPNGETVYVARRASLTRALVLSAAGGAAVYVAIACFVGWRDVGAELGGYAWSTAAGALGLAGLNYLVRFCKWELYLRLLAIRIPLAESLAIYLAGYSLTVTPGKVGEVLKSYLLRETYGVPIARTAGTVVAERVTDLIALVALALVGVSELGGGQRVIVAAAILVGVFLIVASSRTLSHGLIDVAGKLPLIGKLAPKLREFYDGMAVLVRPLPLLIATLLSLVAWAAECLAFWLVVQGFDGAQASFKLCTFIYSAMTIAGALSFLPGGLGVQEGGMVSLLVSTAHGLGKARAAAATFVTRLCTLWFAVLVGLVALLIVQRRRAVDLGKL